MKGRSFCHNLLCSVLTGDRGRAPRRRWTSSFACWVSTSSTRRMCPPMITPHITEGRTQARTRTRVPPHRTPVILHPGQLGIDTHLGQKPKLGGEVRRHRTHLHIMLRRYFVYSCFRSLFSFRSSLLLLSKNTKRPKIFLLFLFGLLLLFALVCFFLFALFELFEKPKKILLCLFFSLGSCLKIENTKNICRSSLVLWVCYRFYQSWVDIGFILLFKPHKWRAIMRINDNLRRGKRLVTNSICLHFCTYTHLCELA